MSIFKEVIFYAIFFFCLAKYLQPLVYAGFCGEHCGGRPEWYYIIVLFGFMMLPALIFAVADYPIRVYLHRQSLKMSHKDLKDEYKETEGSPETKQHRSQFRWELLNGSPTGPKKATFFVRSGRAIIGIRYRPEENPAPMVVAVSSKPESTEKMAGIGFGMRRMVLRDDEFAEALLNAAQPGRPVPLRFLKEIRKSLGALRNHESKHGKTHAGEKALT